MRHDTAINGPTATCPCGWTYETSDVGRLQAAAIGHELEPPEPKPTRPAGSNPPDLEAVAAASVQLERAEDAVANARTLRDRAVREALDRGAAVAHVARAAGLSRQAVYDIIRRQ